MTVAVAISESLHPGVRIELNPNCNFVILFWLYLAWSKLFGTSLRLSKSHSPNSSMETFLLNPLPLFPSPSHVQTSGSSEFSLRSNRLCRPFRNRYWTVGNKSTSTEINLKDTANYTHIHIIRNSKRNTLTSYITFFFFYVSRLYVLSCIYKGFTFITWRMSTLLKYISRLLTIKIVSN